MDGMDVPARPELYFEMLEAMQRRRTDDGIEVQVSMDSFREVSNLIEEAAMDEEEDEEDEDEEEDEEEEEEEEEDDDEEEEEEEFIDTFNTLIIDAPLPDITEHPCEVRRRPVSLFAFSARALPNPSPPLPLLTFLFHPCLASPPSVGLLPRVSDFQPCHS